MLQALLIDRFQLIYHFETRISKVFLLERRGKPLRLKPVQVPHGDSKPSTREGGMGFAAGGWGLSRITMPQLAKFAGDYYLHQPVLDKTGERCCALAGITGIEHFFCQRRLSGIKLPRFRERHSSGPNAKGFTSRSVVFTSTRIRSKHHRNGGSKPPRLTGHRLWEDRGQHTASVA